MFNINEKGILYTLMDMLSRRISLLSLGKYEENLLLYLYERVACSVKISSADDNLIFFLIYLFIFSETRL